MDGIVPKLSVSEKRELNRLIQETSDPRMVRRALIILNLAEHLSPTETAGVVHVARSTVYRVKHRFLAERVAGLVDRREGNGPEELDEEYLAKLYEVVGGSPQDHGWKRPTWTRELLVITLKRLTGRSIHVSTMSHALHRIGARLGRPKPTVACPWRTSEKNKRLQEIRHIIDAAGTNDVVVYEDEVDIHLNPKIGPDWMNRGQQKEVLTPGKNQKHYIAGATNISTGEIVWVEHEKKDTMLFILLLWELTQRYPTANAIHIILDNYCIHSTKQVELSLATEAGSRLQLHFLPPYCPDHNGIERLWRDLHADVTRNHTCETIDELLKEVRSWLRQQNRQAIKQFQTAA